MAKWRLRGRDGAEGADIVGFLGEGTVFTGDVVLKGGTRVDGRIVGKVTAPSPLIIGPNGDIEAEELRAVCVTVCGSLRGTLFIEERLDIQSGGRVSGRLVMAREGLVVAPGGTFEGTVEYSKPVPAGDETHDRPERSLEESLAG